MSFYSFRSKDVCLVLLHITVFPRSDLPFFRFTAGKTVWPYTLWLECVGTFRLLLCYELSATPLATKRSENTRIAPINFSHTPLTKWANANVSFQAIMNNSVQVTAFLFLTPRKLMNSSAVSQKRVASTFKVTEFYSDRSSSDCRRKCDDYTERLRRYRALIGYNPCKRYTQDTCFLLSAALAFTCTKISHPADRENTLLWNVEGVRTQNTIYKSRFLSLQSTVTQRQQCHVIVTRCLKQLQQTWEVKCLMHMETFDNEFCAQCIFIGRLEMVMTVEQGSFPRRKSTNWNVRKQ